MSTDLQPTIDPSIIERVVIHGDLSKLTSQQKVNYYKAVCDGVGLNPLTQPFQYLVLNGKEILYARRECTEQLRKIHRVSIEIRSRELVDGIYVVTARATLPDGRTDENIGAVPLPEQRGEVRANSMMKAETKAKRRVTLSICGLGMLDETEVESIPLEVQPPVVEPGPLEPPPPLPPARQEDPPPQSVYVLQVTTKPTKNPKVMRTTVLFSSGEALTTINDALANLAEELRKDQTLVFVKSKQTKYGPELVGLKRADEPDPQPEMLTDADIPF